jgi:uncharacterized caspase-like protein
MAAQVVQAKCPKCKELLRIPAAWVYQPFRCKHCGVVIQGKPKPPAQTPPPPTEPPPAEPAPFAFDAPIITPPSRFRRRSGGKGRIVALLSGLVLLGLAIGSLYIFFPDFIRSLTKPATPQNPVTDAGMPESPPDAEPASNPATKGVFPRRALLISVNNYLYANPITHGMPNADAASAVRTSNVSTLVDNLVRALHIPANQIAELSDSATRNARAPLKPVIEKTVTSFLKSSRAQDCILLFFIGHAVEVGDDAYLVPIEGELDNKATLIPLHWLYEQLARCPARQKVLVLDVCRFDPARGLERPDGGPMGKKLDALLQKPPEGIQIWSACRAGQHSYELSEAYQSSGIFLDRLFDATNPDNPTAPEHFNLGLQLPQEPMPIAKLAAAVDARTERVARSEHKAAQQPRLVGKDPTGDSHYDPEEPPPEPVRLAEPPEPAGGIAGRALVQGILRETDDIPPVKETASPPQYETLPTFSAKALAEYRPDYASLDELKKESAKYPLRKAVLETMGLLGKHKKSFIEIYPGGPANAQEKAKILQEQEDPATINAELREQLDELQEAGKMRDQEPSKRWQANYDYVLARLAARIAYVEEYNQALGNIRKDNLPELDPKVHTGWRLASQEKLHSKEAKEKATLAKETLAKLIKEQPGTPWEVLAKRDRLTALGLDWQPARYGR